MKLIKKKDEKGFITYDLALSAHFGADVACGKAAPKEDGSVDIGTGDDDTKPRHFSLSTYFLKHFISIVLIYVWKQLTDNLVQTRVEINLTYD